MFACRVTLKVSSLSLSLIICFCFQVKCHAIHLNLLRCICTKLKFLLPMTLICPIPEQILSNFCGLAILCGVTFMFNVIKESNCIGRITGVLNVLCDNVNSVDNVKGVKWGRYIHDSGMRLCKYMLMRVMSKMSLCYSIQFHGVFGDVKVTLHVMSLTTYARFYYFALIRKYLRKNVSIWQYPPSNT